MPSQIAGQLMILMALDSASFTSDMAKVQALAKQMGGEIKAIGGSGSTFGVPTMGAREMKRALIEAGAAATGARNTMEALGVSSTSAFAKAATGIAHILASGSGLGITLAAATAAMALFRAENEDTARVTDISANAVMQARRALQLLKTELADVVLGTKNARLQSFKDGIEDAEAQVERLGGVVVKHHALWTLMLDDEGKARPLSAEQERASELLRIAREKLTTATEKLRLEERRWTADEQRRLDQVESNIASSKAAVKAREDQASQIVKSGEALNAAQREQEAWRKSVVQSYIADMKGEANATDAVGDAIDRVTAGQRALAAAARDVLEELERAEARAFADATRRWHDEDKALTGIRTAGQTDRIRLIEDAAQREIEIVEEEGRKLIDSAQLRGQDEIKIMREVEEAKARIRRNAEEEKRNEARRAALEGNDFGAGMAAQADILRQQLSWGRLGAQVTDVVVNDFGSLSDAIQKIARDEMSASQAGREWLTGLVFDVESTIERLLLMRAILSIFPGLDSAAPAAAGAVSTGASATGAHGGTWRVGGFGGLDSTYVSMKLSPGELVRVTGGANSGGRGGDMPHVTNHIVVRPPAVIANEVAARMDPEAKAGIVYSAVSRGGRRGSRAAD